jgi:predicted peroxiredoxin
MNERNKGGVTMARLLIISTHGSEDPTRAGLAFFMAKGAVEAGHKPEIVLAGDASVLARKVVADSVQPLGIPPLKELVQFALDNNVPVYT